MDRRILSLAFLLTVSPAYSNQQDSPLTSASPVGGAQPIKPVMTEEELLRELFNTRFSFSTLLL